MKNVANLRSLDMGLGERDGLWARPRGFYWSIPQIASTGLLCRHRFGQELRSPHQGCDSRSPSLVNSLGASDRSKREAPPRVRVGLTTRVTGIIQVAWDILTSQPARYAFPRKPSLCAR